MSVIGISLVKDEADIIQVTVENMLNQVDAVIVADNGSMDGTREILETLPITLIDDFEVGYFQSKKMTALAHLAREHGADWVVPFDADEIHYSRFTPTIKEALEAIPPQFLVATIDLYNHVTSSEDPVEELNPVKRIGWRRNYAGDLPKVACRWREDLVIEQGNHGAKYNGGPTFSTGLLVVRHFPYRSPEQFIQKVRNGYAAYKATDLPIEVGAHWRGYGAILESMGEDAVREVYNTWFHLDSPTILEDVIYDPAPIMV